MFRLTCCLLAKQIHNLLTTEPDSIQLLDIRPLHEEVEIINGSLFIDISQLPAALEKKKNQTLFILIDENGEQAKQFVELFKANYPNIAYLEGGIQSWKNQNFPLIKIKNQKNNEDKYHARKID